MKTLTIEEREMIVRKLALGSALAVFVGILAGCSSLPSYQRIDLKSDLSPQTLQRYERTFEELGAAGHHHHDMTTLEHTNWWPLGLFIYYRRGTVMRMDTPDGAMYHVMSGWGLGPLSLIFSSANHATFDEDGNRLSGMGMHNILLGHLAMIHSGDSLLANGHHEEFHSMHLFHHVFNWHRMDDHTYVSLFTVPNAIGFALPHGH